MAGLYPECPALYAVTKYSVNTCHWVICEGALLIKHIHGIKEKFSM